MAKREECVKNNIRLITVYDDYPEDKKPPFDKDCYVYSGFLNEYGYKRMISLIISIANEIGIKGFSIDWDSIANKAYEACHYNANTFFVEKLAKVAPQIEVLEPYKGSNIPILVNNRGCVHSSWKARPYTLLKGIGCPLCGRNEAANTRTKTHDQFVVELSKISSDIEVVGKYEKMTERVEVLCKNCGRKWTPLAYSLLSGKGCPHCSAILGSKKRSNKLSVKSTEQFKQELSKVNPTISILGEYVNNKTKIKAKCKKCGHQWDVVPASLLSGHGCPICARKKGSGH